MRYLVAILIIALFTSGCQTSSIKFTPVIEGQPAPHDGFNLGPEIYVYQGQPCKLSGAVIWIKGLDPNSLGVE